MNAWDCFPGWCGVRNKDKGKLKVKKRQHVDNNLSYISKQLEERIQKVANMKMMCVWGDLYASYSGLIITLYAMQNIILYLINTNNSSVSVKILRTFFKKESCKALLFFYFCFLIFKVMNALAFDFNTLKRFNLDFLINWLLENFTGLMHTF